MLAAHFDGLDGSPTMAATAGRRGRVLRAWRMTDGTWNLYLIAVRPDRQGQGRGGALLRHVEQALAVRGARILLVETSGLPALERTRAFYRKCGYDQEARIRDFYKAGDDKIVFRKALAAPGT